MAGARDGQPDLQVHLGEVDGIEIVLRGVEFTADGVVVHLFARQDALTHELDAAYRTAFEAWAKEAIAARRRGERPPDAPAQPGAMLNEISLRLQDDAGTSYWWRSSQAAGTGTEWDAVWRFEPEPPPEATQLSVALDAASGSVYSLLL